MVLRSLPVPAPRRYEVRASGADGRLLARQQVTIAPGADVRRSQLAMPSELRNQTTRIEVEGEAVGGCGAARRRALAAAAGRHRRAAQRRGPAAA